MILESLARRLSRGGREFQTISDAELWRWAQGQGSSPRQALEAALQAGIFPECYERNFPSLSAAEQLLLFQSRVLVVGLGGLGGYLAELLARVGVGTLLLADGDIFTPSNLNRQLLATQNTLGKNKAQVAARRLAELNPALSLEPIPHFLHQGSLRGYLPRVQVALDALDTVKARRELWAAAREARRPLVHGAVLGKFGQVATILPDDPNPFAKLYPRPDSPPEAREALASTVTLVASLQTQEAVRLLLGQPPVYHGKLAHFDGETGRLEVVALD
jgi:sulfur carrier protein ThiS adenylyltransferase